MLTSAHGCPAEPSWYAGLSKHSLGGTTGRAAGCRSPERAARRRRQDFIFDLVAPCQMASCVVPGYTFVEGALGGERVGDERCCIRAAWHARPGIELAAALRLLIHMPCWT